VPEAWVGRSLRDLQRPRRHSISVVAVHDVLVDRIQPVPDPDAPLKESDTLIVAGTDESLAKAAKIR
ncbi:MAG TPA: TrkA C-terminal domain-containing protein, partial [Longimicrobiales bacterium]|nr:TrkA C-terminal domain-containing protein [Longimicrobiales bacterium]